ncbi:universal stress protein [Alkalihalobacterium chitinilyticum]|uniref:Universal stress protein n=1 Tax=Alkalihalobacterium chitinilyticum TaxID=2980103 RepID=A0ABT5VDW7_9BACI|nr:universal stress protein [Alkalihalobacterium chitinilyticum]MDE5413460.1 universal stress protein [Alkalihalobacterium chitinilyticum]
MFQQILLAADGSKHSIRAAEKAIQLVKNQANSLVEVIYVINGSTSKADALRNNDSKQMEEQRREKLKDIINLLTKEGIKHQVNILHGEPGPTVVEYANDKNFDCLVIGSRGLNALQSMVLGSVSHKVAKRVKCPVMIVK